VADPDKVSYKSPYYDALDARVTEKYNLPPGLLSAVRLRGERSNADQVSPKGAQSVYQIIQDTRDRVLKRDGVDAYLSPENAADVAGMLLSESLKRNKGDSVRAVAEYNGGTDPKNWNNPETRAYVRRVTGSNLPGESTYDREKARGAESNVPNLAAVYDAYKSGRMTPEDAAQYEADIAAGRVLAPRGATVKAPQKQAQPSDTIAAPEGVINAWKDQRMTADERREFETDVREGRITVPADVRKMIGDEPGMLSRARDAAFETISGAERETETTRKLPEWTASPELNKLSGPSFKAALGTMFAGPKEAMDVIKAQFPDTQIRQDEKGNYIFKSSIDGKEYAVKPGFTWGDVPRALGAIAAFTPAAGATSVGGAAAASAGTEAAIQASQAATGGEFNTGEVLAAGALGGAVPVVGRVADAVLPPVVGAVRNALPGAQERAAQQAVEARVLAGVEPPQPPRGGGAPAPAAQQPAAPAPAVAQVERAAGPAQPVAPELTVPPASSAAPAPAARAAAETLTPESAPRAAVAPGMTAPAPGASAEEIAATARKAATGNKSATERLAEYAAPDAEGVAAAKRLGIEDYLQPDHITTNQAFRELSQAAKSVPGSEARAAELQGLAEVTKRAEKIITDIGGSRDLSTFSQKVFDTLDSSYKQLKDAARKQYADLREAIPAKTRAAADETLSFIKSRADEMGGVKNLSAAERELTAKLTPKKGVEPTYALLDQLRKDIGAAKRGTDNVFKTADNALLGQLEERLILDQGRVAEQLGMREAWDAARATTRAYKSIQDDMTALFGKQLNGSIVPKMGTAMGQLTKGDNSHLVGMLKAIPPELRQEAVASGLQNAFNVSGRDGVMNFGSFVKWWEGLERNAQARNALFANLPDGTVSQLRDLYKVAQGVAASSRERITTGRINYFRDVIGAADSLMGRLYDVAKRSAAGAAAELVTTPIGLPGAGVSAAIASALTKGKPNAMKAVDSLISSPEFARAVRTGSKQDINRLARSGKFAAFVRASGNPKEMRDREKWISTIIQVNRSKSK